MAIKEKRREQILASALEVFAQKGYHASGVADILDHSGISRGTFYLYF
ncbi:MAG: helix-turn-helix transcriptional regulator, partial [Candidatus Sericytochromatia bacterium]|nr:helix-turn-helix transcriptional regulator [Candidatus Tanganyikabacteria bacterium]